MTTTKASYKSQTSTPRNTNRGGNKNLKRSPASHYELGRFVNKLLHRCSERMSTVWQKLRRRFRQRRKPQSLHVYDVASLGDKRFVAVVQYGRRRFLVGGGAGSVSLLSKLDREDLPAPLQAGREVRGNVAPVPLISAADDASPFNVKIAEAVAGARLAI
jgi:hypothetical protein